MTEQWNPDRPSRALADRPFEEMTVDELKICLRCFEVLRRKCEDELRSRIKAN